MKANLRMFCMALVAAATTMISYAQAPQNFTGKLWNYDFEKGPHGWDFTAESSDQNYNPWMPQTKGPEKGAGYHGYANLALEIWKGAGSGVKDNSASQTLKNLPNGTYVFGAYMTATNDSWEPSIDVIEGVYIFANEDEMPVATHRVEGMNEKWAHSIKFNVATVVEDGTLKVGAKCVSTNASFLTIDNATLYYFGDMSKSAALYEMAKLDMAASVAVADTCLAHTMNVDTLAYLNGAIAAAKAIEDVEDAAQLDEDVYWGIRLAVKSIASYNKLGTALASAKEIRDMEWSDFAFTVNALNALKELINEADAMYTEAKVHNVYADTMAMKLDEAAALLQLDSCYIKADEYAAISDELPTSGEAGEYTQAMVDQIEAIIEEILLELDSANEGAISAVEAKKNCEARFAQIQSIIDSPVAFAEFPIIIPREETIKLNDHYLLKGATLNANGYATFTSPLYRFNEPLTRVRFIIKENGGNKMCGNYPFTSLATFHMFDEEGNQIELTEENVYSNADFNKLGGNDGQGIMGMLDNDPNTYFHTTYNVNHGINEYHYIEVVLPEDEEYTAFSFTITARPNAGLTNQFPAVLDIRYVSDVVTELQQLVAEVDAIAPVQGTSVGLYNTDVTVFYNALAIAKELIAADYASEEDAQAAFDNLKAAAENLNKSLVWPDPEKQYRVVSAVAFIDNLDVQKAITGHLDGDSIQRLYWETAIADSIDQLFAFEKIENDEGKYLYTMKQVTSGLYVNTYYRADSTVDHEIFSLSLEPGEVELRPQGEGRFTVGQGPLGGYHDDVNYMHANGHNTGKGEGSHVIKWNTEPSGTSWWYIREMTKLPATVESASADQFRTPDLHLYAKVNQLTLTADKDCAFEDLKVYDKKGEEISYTAVKNGATATLVLDAAKASISFAFANAEGVSSVKVEGSLTTKSDVTKLQNAYDAAIAVKVVEGDEVGQVKDLSAYNKAIATAEEILLVGGSDDLIAKTTEDLKAAVANIKYNLPEEGKNYFIQSALPWMTRWNSEMDIFVRDDSDYVYWNYVNIRDLNHQWQFIACGERNGMPAYYLKNVGTELYLSTPRPAPLNNANGGRLFMTEDTDSTGTEGYYAAPFNIHFLSEGKVAIGDAREGNANGSWCLHPMNHSSGTGYVAYGYMISWGKGDAASAMRIVSAEKVIADFMTNIEDVEIADEQVAPAAKGIYDLFGRRIMTPAATGIYIVDGKKRVIKK